MPLWFVNPGKRRKRTRGHKTMSRSFRKRLARFKAARKATLTKRARGKATAKHLAKLRKATRKLLIQHRHKKMFPNPRKRPRKAKKGRKMAKLYGAAKKARNKRLAKLRRKRKSHRRYKRNPARGHGFSKAAMKKLAAAAKRAAKKGKRKGKKSKARGHGFTAATMAKLAKLAKKGKRKSRKGKRKGVSKAAARARGKKAARTRKANKAKRSAAAKKAYRKSKKGHKKMAKKRRKSRKGHRKLKARARRKRYGRGVRQLARARRSIRHQRKHGSGLAKRFIKRFRMRSNPMGAFVDTMKTLAPVAVSFFAARAAAGKMDQVPGVGPMLDKLGEHKAVAVSAAVMGLGYALTHYLAPIRKYQHAVMAGTGLNLIFTAVQTYVPQNIKAMIGMGDYEEVGYSADMAGYSADMAGYSADMANYETVDDYEEVGAEEDLAGFGGTVSRAASTRALPARGMVDEIGSESGDLYSGVFSGNGWGA